MSCFVHQQFPSFACDDCTGRTDLRVRLAALETLAHEVLDVELRTERQCFDGSFEGVWLDETTWQLWLDLARGGGR